ncbi:MAG: hypothetical protein FJ098_08655 [Deltaproteobacteria bacterium]|nr:hypothetical protein [Deltaproteobacteria bacterium]
MVRSTVPVLALLVLSASPAAAGPGKKVKTAILQADQGVVFATGEVILDGTGMKVDLVAHKHGEGLDLRAGRQGTSYLPLHRFTPGVFGKFKQVPCVAPGDGEKNGLAASPKKGEAFTVMGNKSPGVWRVRVKFLKGGKVKVQFQKCP